MSTRSRLAIGFGVALTLAGLGFLALRASRPTCDVDCFGFTPQFDEARTLDRAHRLLDEKNPREAINAVGLILKLDPTNPEALALREQAMAALAALAADVAEARQAASSGDLGRSADALERVIKRDPTNPVMLELATALDPVFKSRVAAAAAATERAKALAMAAGGAAEEPPFARALSLVDAATRNLKARHFTIAASEYMEARDAYDRARTTSERAGTK